GHGGPVALLDADRRLVAVVEDRDGAARPLVVLAPAEVS
nr:tRNA pseudouridine(55) synthase TruB [Euzebyales bacterium]